MSDLNIDYSAIQSPVAGQDASEWEPPIHKFFGKKLPNGKTEREPIYSYQEYPRMLYALKNGKIQARVVNSDQEKDALGEGWEKTPAAFGYIGAPSFDQLVNMREKKDVIEDATVDAPRRGRPPKGE